MPEPYAKRMKMLGNFVLCACLAAASAAPAAAWPTAVAQDSSQETARQRQAQGHNLPVREIERRIVPRIPGAQYLGFDFDPATDVYTLKFLRNGTVIWVDVDGRTAKIVRRTGN